LVAAGRMPSQEKRKKKTRIRRQNPKNGGGKVMSDRKRENTSEAGLFWERLKQKCRPPERSIEKDGKEGTKAHN